MISSTVVSKIRFNPRIVIGDEDPYDRASLSNYLRERKFDVVEAENTGEILSIIDKVPPCLVILAEKMKLLDGFQLCALIRERQERLSLPVILLLDKHSQSKMYKAMNVGADAVFVRNNHSEAVGYHMEIENYINTNLRRSDDG